MLTDESLAEFLAERALPETYADDARRYFLPLAAWLEESCPAGSIIGVAGPQGTGKSTVAELLAIALCASGRSTECLSLDDFYLTRAEREELGRTVHPLFATRGVPGTHDIVALERACEQLASPGPPCNVELPVFDKSIDDRAAAARRVAAPVDLVIVEGWCVGVPPQPAAELDRPVNDLEREHDGQAAWRRQVNDELGGAYADFFARLDTIVWLQPPDFDAIVRWRQEQERKLAVTAGRSDGVMDAAGIRRFVDYFERLTRHGMRTMPRRADAVIELDRDHRCAHLHYAAHPAKRPAQ